MSPIDRRTVLRSLGVGATASIAGCLGTVRNELGASDERGTRQSAPMFQYDAANTGASAAVTGPTEEVSEQWTVPIEGQNAFSTTQPAVVDGTVYVGTQKWGGDLPSEVLAVDAEDGSEEWRFDTETSVSTAPAVVDDRVYVVTDGELRSLSSDDGEELWSVTVGGIGHPGSSPIVVDGTVYVGSDESGLYAISSEDGEVLWTLEDGGLATGIAVSDGRLVTVSARNEGNALAFDTESGEQLWQAQLHRAKSYPIIADDTVFVLHKDPNRDLRNSDTLWHALDVTSGDPLYRMATDEQDYDVEPDTMAIGDSVAFVADHDGGLTGFDRDGTKRWTLDLVDDFALGAPVVADGIAYVTGNIENTGADSDNRETTGMLFGVTADGEIVFEQSVFESSMGVTSPLTVVDDTFYTSIMTAEERHRLVALG